MEKLKSQIARFKKETGIKLELKEEKPYYGGYLYLRGTGITSLPDGLTVGDSLYLRGTGITDTSMVKSQLTAEARVKIEERRNPILGWEWNGETYIKVDGIFSQVIYQRGNVYRIRQIGKEDVQYLVTDGENRWAHGDTIKEARADLIYKISSRDTCKYDNLTLDSELTFAECIQCYRVITGACASGSRGFIESRLPRPHKKAYTIREVIELTKGEYGSEKLKEFFNK